jgi:hypothetical protein
MLGNARHILLRANGGFLVTAALGGWFQMDFPASISGAGPLGPLIAHERSLGIGFIEAHGLALIIGILLWRAPTQRSWHFTAAAVHLLLGVSNLVFWQLFLATNTLPMGYITTTFHGLFFGLQAFASFHGSPGMGRETQCRELGTDLSPLTRRPGRPRKSD